MSLVEELKCGSNLAISGPWPTTRSFVCVLVAGEGPDESWGVAPATPRAAAPLSSSRRVTVMGETSLWDVDTAGRGNDDRTCVGGHYSASGALTPVWCAVAASHEKPACIP